jgi:hypothetical protein
VYSSNSHSTVSLGDVDIHISYTYQTSIRQYVWEMYHHGSNEGEGQERPENSYKEAAPEPPNPPQERKRSRDEDVDQVQLRQLAPPYVWFSPLNECVIGTALKYKNKLRQIVISGKYLYTVKEGHHFPSKDSFCNSFLDVNMEPAFRQPSHKLTCKCPLDADWRREHNLPTY